MGRITTGEPEHPPHPCFLVSCDVNHFLHTLLSLWAPLPHPSHHEPSETVSPDHSSFKLVMSDTGVTRIKNDYIAEELGNTSGEILCLAIHSAEGLATLDPKLWVFPLPCRVPTKTHSFRGGPSTLSHRLSYAILTCTSCIPYYSYITTSSWILKQVIHFKHITVLVHGTKLVQMHRGACSKPWRNATQGSIPFALHVHSPFAHRQTL